MKCRTNGSSLVDDFHDYVNNFDFGKYVPFYHGTIKDMAREIVTVGLLTKNDMIARGLEIEEKWGSTAISLPDRVYFDSCVDKHRIAMVSCERMIEASTENVPGYQKLLSEKYSGENRRSMLENECAIIELVNWRKYVPYFDIDEDAFATPLQLKRFFTFNDVESFKLSLIPSIILNMDAGILQFYEKGFAFLGSDAVLEMIERTPHSIFSLGDIGTFSIKSSIDARDLRIVSIEEYAGRKSCYRSHVLYSSSSSGRDLYYKVCKNHDRKNMEEFRKALKAKYAH